MMSHQHGRFAFARGFFEALAHQRNEFRQARGLHGQLAIVALTDQRLGECLLRQTRAHVLGLVTGLREPAMPSATPSRIVARSRIETRSARRICSTRWIPETVMRLGTRSLTKSACSLQFLLEFLHLSIGEQFRHIVLEELGEMRRQHGRGINHRIAFHRRFLFERAVDPCCRESESWLGGVRAGQFHLPAGRIHNHVLPGPNLAAAGLDFLHFDNVGVRVELHVVENSNSGHDESQFRPQASGAAP